MTIEFIILIAIICILFVVLFRRTDKAKDLLQYERERINDQFESKVKLVEKELENKKDIILEAVKRIDEQLTKSSETDVSIKTVMEQHQKTAEALHTTTSDLKNLLSNNQLRGEWGQTVCEDLLKLAGFQKGINYVAQIQQESNSSRPDITILLPDKTKLHVDVKFPFSALQKYQESQDKQHLAQFKSDVKNKIKEITSRDYINPDENTLDFAVMFIPNEMIFSFIYEKFPDVWMEAQQNKVIMAGPFSLTAILRMIQQAYDNFRYQQNIHEIVSHIRAFEKEYLSFSAALDVLGNRLESTQKAFSQVSVTRDKKLQRIVERIRTDEELLIEEGQREPVVE